MKNLVVLFLITVFCLLPLTDMVKAGLPMTHDGIDHVARIANFYQSLMEGNLIPRWAANLNWGYGHPILMFLYPLPSYLASLFHYFGTSFIDSTKLVFALTYIVSGYAMYLWLQAFMGKKAALVGAIAYCFAPYRFVDLYVRGALGEHVAFIFPPLICFALYRLANSKRSIYLVIGSLSVAGLLLSHNAISLMFLPIIILYLIYLFFTNGRQWRVLLLGVLLLLWGFLLSAFFWMPAFFEGKYTLRDIVTKGEYAARFESWTRLLYSEWNYGGTGQFSVQVGIVQWLGVLLSPLVTFLYLRKKNPRSVLALASVLLLFISLFFITNGSRPLWQIVTILQKFQFPWRLLSLVVFFSSLLLALAVDCCKQRLKGVVGVFLILFLLLFSYNFWHARNYIEKPESYFSGIYNGTTDTGESAPIWSIRFMEHRPKAESEVIDGSAKIKMLQRNSTAHRYQILAETPTRILENTLYFPGWTVEVDGKPVSIEFQDQRFRGLITYFVPQGVSDVSIRFSETKFRSVSDILSFSSFVLVILYTLYLLTSNLWRRFR